MQSNNVTIMPEVRWDAVDKTIEIHPTMVADRVRQGWVVLATYMGRSDVTESVYVNGCMETRVRTEYVPVVLMGQLVIDAVREENASLRARVALLTKCEADLGTLRREHETLERNHAQVTASEKSAWESIEVHRQQRADVDARNRKMEIDIAKLRAALGELRMKEILGS